MILVVGATGYLGGAVTRILLAQSKPVRILARSQSNDQPLAEAGAQVVLGDLKQRSSLDAACQGIETVITTANSFTRGGEDTVQTVDLEGNRHLIEAAKAAGVKQFIFVSVFPADPNSPVPFFQAKGKTEDYLRESGISYTILAPNGYMEVMLGGVVGMPALMGQPVTIVGEGRHKHSFISASDVAAFILAAIGNPAAINQKLLLGGPQPLSYRDAVVIYERVLARPIPVRNVAAGSPVPGLSEKMAQMLAGMDTYDSPIDMTQTACTFGIQLTPLEEVARRPPRVLDRLKAMNRRIRHAQKREDRVDVVLRPGRRGFAAQAYLASADPTAYGPFHPVRTRVETSRPIMISSHRYGKTEEKPVLLLCGTAQVSGRR